MEQSSQEKEDSRASGARRADVAQADDDEDDRDAEGDDVAAIHFLCQTKVQMSKSGRSFEGSAVSGTKFFVGNVNKEHYNYFGTFLKQQINI